MTPTFDAPDNAAPLGPYSHAGTDGTTLWTAGQIPVTPDGEVLAEASMAAQTELALENVERILDEAGLELDDVLKTTVFTTDISAIERTNERYRSYFDGQPPARTVVEVCRLADGAAIEVEAIASAPATDG